MAEKPGELNIEISLDVKENSSETIENVYLKDRSDDEKTDTNATETSSDPDEIRANIEETRAEMSEMIDAIQEKLSYENISEQVKEEVSEYVNETYQTVKNTVYETATRKAGEIMNYVEKGVNELADTKVVKTARQNPLALTLIGLGIGMLLISGRRNKTVNYRYKNYSERDYSSKDNQSMMQTAQNKLENAAGTVSDTVSSTASAVSGTISNVAGTVSDTVSNVAGKAYNQVGNLGSYATDVAGTAQDQFEYYMEENPLAVGAVAMALGAAVGLSIPSTRVENRYMGEARENLMQMAGESARNAVGKVQQVAGQVTETVKEEVKNQGLT